MPPEPNADNAPPPPELPCWYGFSFAPEDIEEMCGNAPTPVSTPSTKLRQALGIVTVAVGVPALFGAVLFALVSLLTGHVRLIASLVFVHLPLIAFVVRVVRLGRNFKNERRQKLELPENLGQAQLSFVPQSRSAVRPDGCCVGNRVIPWNHFVPAERRRESDNCFVVRLRYKDGVLPPGFAELQQREQAKNAQPKEKEAATKLAFLTPPLVTVYLAVSGLLTYGWRADVIAAMCLVALWVTAIPTWLIGYLSARDIRALSERKQTHTLDLLFDSRHVGAQDALTRINGWIEAARREGTP